MTRLDRIRAYYAQIDRNDVATVLTLFGPDAVYERADRSYCGKERIGRFFREERRIRGRHSIENIWQMDETVVVVGLFDGVGEAGDARRVGFTDIWSFGASDLVSRRRTFLATGHAIVER